VSSPSHSHIQEGKTLPYDLSHNHCYTVYRPTRQTCPVCDTPWNGDFEGELKKISGGEFVDGQGKHSRARGRADDDDEDDIGEGVEEGEAPSPSQTQKGNPFL